MTEPADKSSRRLLVSAALATAAFGLALAFRVPFGIPGEWVWRPNQLSASLWPSVAAGLCLVAVVWLACRPVQVGPRVRAVFLVLLVLAAFALQCSLLNAIGLPWVTPGAIVASPVATTYYSVSLDIRDPARWLANYPEQMRTLPYHARTHPPGFPLFFLALRRATAVLVPHPSGPMRGIADAYRQFGIGPTPTDAAAAIAGAVLIGLLGALSLLPAYLLGRHLIGAEAALFSACLMASTPALLLFGPSSDEIVLTLAVATLALSYSAWRSSSLPQAFAAGLVFALGLFFSFGLLALAGWLLVWAGLGIVRSDDHSVTTRRALRMAAAGVAGLAIFYVALYYAVGYRAVAVAREALLAHHGVTTGEAARTYWKWILMDPLECAAFMGLPLLITAFWSLRAARADPGLSRWRTFLLSWLVTFAVLDISGTVRGEVGRIWLFLLWPAALAAGPWLAARPRRAELIALLAGLGVWQAILMRGYLTLYDIF